MCAVSSRDQCEERQLVAMREFGVSERNIYADKLSGKNFERPQYKCLVRRIRAGDVLVIESIDSLGEITPRYRNSGGISPR